MIYHFACNPELDCFLFEKNGAAVAASIQENEQEKKEALLFIRAPGSDEQQLARRLDGITRNVAPSRLIS